MGYTARGQTAVNVDSPNIGFHNLTFLRGGGSWKSPCIMSYQTCQTCYIMSYPTKALAMTLKREDEIGPQVNLIRRRFGSSKAIPLKTKAPYYPIFKEGTNPCRHKKRKWPAVNNDNDRVNNLVDISFLYQTIKCQLWLHFTPLDLIRLGWNNLTIF